MLDKLFDLIRNESQQEIIENPAIPNQQNGEAIGLAADSVYGTLQKSLAAGGLGKVLELFAGNENQPAHHPLAQDMKESFISKLMRKFNLNSAIAGGIAATLIPAILNKLVKKTNDPNDSSFNINDIIGSLTGAPKTSNGVEVPGYTNGQTAGGIDFGNILNSMKNKLDANQDGQINLNDLGSVLSGNAGKAREVYKEEREKGGGIWDIFKKFGS